MAPLQEAALSAVLVNGRNAVNQKRVSHDCQVSTLGGCSVTFLRVGASTVYIGNDLVTV
jgi:hypothetical protein